MSTVIDKTVQRIKLMIVKALLKQVVDNDEIQLVKIEGLAGEVQDGIERLQNYGMTSNPPEDSEAVVAYLNGNRDHGVVIVCDSGTFRLKQLETGEVALYSKFNQAILLNKEGDINATMTKFVVGTGADWVAMASKVQATWDALEAALLAFVPNVPPDGGAALSALLLATIQAAATDFASTNLKADL